MTADVDQILSDIDDLTFSGKPEKVHILRSRIKIQGARLDAALEKCRQLEEALEKAKDDAKLTAEYALEKCRRLEEALEKAKDDAKLTAEYEQEAEIRRLQDRIAYLVTLHHERIAERDVELRNLRNRVDALSAANTNAAETIKASDAALEALREKFKEHRNSHNDCVHELQVEIKSLKQRQPSAATDEAIANPEAVIALAYSRIAKIIKSAEKEMNR